MTTWSRRLALLAAIAVGAGALALVVGLRPSASPALLSDPHSGIGRETPRQERAFGDEPIFVVVDGDLATKTLVGENVLRLVALERRIGALPGVRSVFGPGTFLTSSLDQMQRVFRAELGSVAATAGRAARAAADRARAAGASAEQASAAGERARLQALGPRRAEYRDLLVRFGSMGIPSLVNRDFVLSVVFGAGVTPKPRFAWLFPDAGHALIYVRPTPGLDEAATRRLGHRVQRLIAHSGLDSRAMHVAGVPLVVAATAHSFAADMLRLAPIALIALSLVLLVGFRGGRQRLRLLWVAAGAGLLTAAACRVLGLGLTPATIAALPVVIGVAVDFGVQLQARFRTELRSGVPAAAAATRARRALLPTLALASAAMSVGFLTLLLSPIPLMHRLGLTLAAGTAISLLMVVAAGPPLMAWRATGRDVQAPTMRTLPRVRALPLAGLLAVVFGVSLAGIAAAGGTHVESDLFKLAPRGLPEARELADTQRTLRTGGILRLAVTAPDVLSPSVLEWQRAAVRRAVATDARLRPGPNVADVLLGSGTASDAAGIQRLARLIPGAFLHAVVTPDARRAEVSFGVPPVSSAEQARMLSGIVAAMRPLPAGVHVTPVGLLARGTESVDDLQHARPRLLLIALAAALIVLLLVRRRWDRALIPLVPTVVVAGTSALALRVLGVSLSPLGASLEPLVLAVGLEFGLLLEARYREARERGLSVLAARDDATRHVGGAVAVSALAVAVAFAALAASRLVLLQQFGLLVAGEVVLCAAVAIWVVPALCATVDLRRTAPSASRVRKDRTAEACV